MKTLIVIDMQNDFIDGSLGTHEAQKIVPKAKKKIEEYISRGDWVVFTRDTHHPNYLQTQEGRNLPVPHCVLLEHGWKISNELEDYAYNYDNAGVVNKGSFGYDRWFDWEHEMSDKIELIGLCTDCCVVSNALILKANFPETEITVDASCCAGTTPENHKAALQVMKSCQINVVGE